MTLKPNIVKEWVQKGENDLKTAQILTRNNGPTDIICFHTLDAYYITSRYPEGPTFYPKNEAENALESATKIIKFIKQLLSPN